MTDKGMLTFQIHAPAHMVATQTVDRLAKMHNLKVVGMVTQFKGKGPYLVERINAKVFGDAEEVIAFRTEIQAELA